MPPADPPKDPERDPRDPCKAEREKFLEKGLEMDAKVELKDMWNQQLQALDGIYEITRQGGLADGAVDVGFLIWSLFSGRGPLDLIFRQSGVQYFEKALIGKLLDAAAKGMFKEALKDVLRTMQERDVELADLFNKAAGEATKQAAKEAAKEGLARFAFKAITERSIDSGYLMWAADKRWEAGRWVPNEAPKSWMDNFFKPEKTDAWHKARIPDYALRMPGGGQLEALIERNRLTASALENLRTKTLPSLANLFTKYVDFASNAHSVYGAFSGAMDAADKLAELRHQMGLIRNEIDKIEYELEFGDEPTLLRLQDDLDFCLEYNA